MAFDFKPTLPDEPISFRRFQEQTAILNDPAQASELTFEELSQMRAERAQFNTARERQRDRLLGQGLSPAQVEKVEEALFASQVDADDESLENQARQSVSRDVAGGVEGAKQAVEGVFDLAKDIAVGIGAESEESREEFKEGVRQRRVKSRVEQAESFGRLPGNGWEIVGQVVPWIASSTGNAANVLPYLARNAFLGGAATASQFQPSGDEFSDRLWDLAIGASVGTAVASVAGVPSFLRTRGARRLVKDFNNADPEQRALVESMLQEMTGNPDFKFSVAQLTGTRFYQNLELTAAAQATKTQQNTNINTLYNNIVRLASAQGAQGKSAGQIALGLRNTLKKAKEDIYQQAQGNWQAASENLIKLHGDDAVIRGRDYLGKIDKLIREEESALLNMGAKPSANLRAYRDQVDEIVNPVRAIKETTPELGTRVYVLDSRSGQRLRVLGDENDIPALMAEAEKRAIAMNEAAGGPTAKETLDILAGLNRLIGGKTAIFENAAPGSNRQMGRALMGIFTDELQHAPTNREAAAGVRALREGYRADMAAAEAIDESIVNAVFGRKKLPNNPGKKLDFILKGEAEDLAQLRTFLDEYNPELLDELRTTHLQRIVKSSEKPNKPDVDTEVDLDKLAKNLADSFGRGGKAGQGLHTPATQADMQLTADALRIIKNKYFTGVTPGGVRVEEFTINLISRSPEFAGRFLTRLFASGETLETVLLNPEWRKAVQQIALEPLNSDAGRGALLFLSMWGAEAEEARANRKAAEVQIAASQAFANDPARGGTVQ